MDGQLVGTLTHDNWMAEIYSTNMPGEFRVVYRDPSGKHVEETPLTGISSYKQREGEIFQRMHALASGAQPLAQPDLGDSGEY